MTAILRRALAAVVAAGLVIDAWTHLHLAPDFDLNTTGSVNEGILFRIEGVVALLVAALVLIRANALTAALSALVGGGGAFVLLLYRYVDVGRIGPVPDMYEPVWYRDKVLSLAGELAAFAAAVALLAVVAVERRRAARVTRRGVATRAGPATLAG